MMKKIVTTQKEKYPAFSSPAWLLIGLIHSLPGQLQFRDQQLTFIAFHSGTLGSKSLSKLEKKLRISGLESRLNTSQTTPIFKTSVSHIQSISFPLLYFSAGMHIRINDVKYRLSFIRPNNTRMYAKSMAGIQDITGSVNIGKEWKKLLLPK